MEKREAFKGAVLGGIAGLLIVAIAMLAFLAGRHVDDGEARAVAPAAVYVPIPAAFGVDTGPDEELRARLREIDEGVRGPRNP